MRRDETPPQAVTTARVVVLLDASRHSQVALAAAVELAGRQRAELVARKHRNWFSTHPLTYRYLAEDFSRRFYGSGNGDGRIGDHR